MKEVGVGENKVIPYENLNWETASYWTLLVKHIKQLDMEDQIEHILPELVHFCSYIEG